MNKYTGLSDFEINKRVSNLVSNGEYTASEEKQEVYLVTKDGEEILPIAYFDPCNNVEQAWEIMMTHNICVTKDGRKFRAIRNMKWDGVETWCSGSAYHKKPLVAAMLCFLELQNDNIN